MPGVRASAWKSSRLRTAGHPRGASTSAALPAAADPRHGKDLARDVSLDADPSKRGNLIRTSICEMEEFKARRVVDALRDRGVNAHLFRGTTDFGVRVTLPGGREAEWDNDGTAGLEAQVMQDGDLVGFVPTIEGSEEFDEAP